MSLVYNLLFEIYNSFRVSYLFRISSLEFSACDSEGDF